MRLLQRLAKMSFPDPPTQPFRVAKEFRKDERVFTIGSELNLYDVYPMGELLIERGCIVPNLPPAEPQTRPE